MGFFDEIQAKLKALEAAALEAQAEQQRQHAGAQQKKVTQLEETFEHGVAGSGSRDPHRGHVTDPIDGGGAPSSPEESAFSNSEQVQQLKKGTTIFDNLGGRLDEAFLIQEILGEPRCVRGWDN